MKLSENTWVKITLGTVIIVLISIISVTSVAATWKTEIEIQVDTNTISVEENEEKIKVLMHKIGDQSEILAKMAVNIEWIKLRLEGEE